MTPASQLLVVRSEPLCAESSLELQDDGLTPLSALYVRNNFPVPPPATRLSVGGAVNQPYSLAPEDLWRLPRRRLTATLECAGNGRAFMNPPVPGEQWRLGAVSTADWEGVPLAAVLGEIEIGADAAEVVFTGADGFVRSLPIDDALSDDVLVVDTMNGAPLTRDHPVSRPLPGRTLRDGRSPGAHDARSLADPRTGRRDNRTSDATSGARCRLDRLWSRDPGGAQRRRRH